jgi:hypothetical protein
MVSERLVHLTAYDTAPKDFDFSAVDDMSVAPGVESAIIGGAHSAHIAAGSTTEGNRTKAQHPLPDGITAPPDFLTLGAKTKATPVERSVNDATRVVLAKAHASLMLFAWMAFLSSGILSARFLRDHWPDSRPVFNSPVWFLLHRGANLIGLMLSSLSIVLIFQANGWAWHGPSFGGSGPGGTEKVGSRLNLKTLLK